MGVVANLAAHVHWFTPHAGGMHASGIVSPPHWGVCKPCAQGVVVPSARHPQVTCLAHARHVQRKARIRQAEGMCFVSMQLRDRPWGMDSIFTSFLSPDCPFFLQFYPPFLLPPSLWSAGLRPPHGPAGALHCQAVAPAGGAGSQGGGRRHKLDHRLDHRHSCRRTSRNDQGGSHRPTIVHCSSQDPCCLCSHGR